MNYLELQENFSIPSNIINEAIFSLTHKKMLNLKNYEGNAEKLEYYCEIGKCVFDILLKNFIRDEYTKQTNIAAHCLNYSKLFFLNKFFEKYDLQKYIICEVGNDNWKKMKDDIIRQFIGFLYLETSYKNLQRLFINVFTIDELIVTNDYKTVLNNLAKGKKIEFFELGKNGSDDKPEYIYELVFNGQKTIATGTSKKAAQYNCAEKYCKKFLSKEEMFGILGFSRKPRKRYEHFFIDKTKLLIMNKISHDYDIDKNDTKICFTHVSSSNKYIDEDNSSMVSIGASVEYLYLHRFINEQLQITNMRQLKKLVTFLHTNKEVYKLINQTLNLDRAIIMMSEDSLGAKVSACNDTIKSLFFVTFMTGNNTVFKEKIFNIYTRFLKNVDFRFLEPCTYLQEFFQDYGVTQINYLTSNENELSFKSKVYMEISGHAFLYEGRGKTKSQANSNVAKALLKEIYDSLDYVFSGRENLCNPNYELVESLVLMMLSNSNNFWKYVKEKDYFAYSLYINSDVKGFTNRLSQIIKVCIDHLKKETNTLIIGFIKNLYNDNYVLYKGIMNEVLIQNIWDYYRKNEGSEPYQFYINVDKLMELSYKKIKDRLTKNGLLINEIDNPSEELQLIAVKNNKKAFDLIKEPATALIQYMYENDKNFLLDKSSEKNIEFIKNLKKKEILDLKDKSNDKIGNYFILEPHCFDIYIKALFEIFDIESVLIAVGFVYASGLKLLGNELIGLLKEQKQIELIIGSLQDYSLGRMVKGMDRKTALHINELINRGCVIRTNESCFYHGKVYIFLTANYTITITGSTNLSLNAFRNNKELDSLFIYPRHEINPFLKWFNDFRRSAGEIKYLDVSKFNDICLSDIEGDSQLQNLTEQDIKKRIANVPDELLRDRLLLWLQYKPSNIYDNIIVTEKSYIAIEFSEKSMIVLETFLPGNSYFVFYNVKILQLINMITEKTKSEIFEMSDMEKRGYHVREKLTLELNIKSYFLGK